MTYARNIGFLRPSRLWLAARPGVVVAMVWIAALMPALPGVRAEPAMADAPPLTTINEVKTAAEGRLPVCVRGVLTFRIGEGFVLQDDSAGAWVEVTQARRMELLRSEIAAIMQLRPGDDVEIVGMSDRGGYAPTILPVTVSKVGERPLPEARPYDRNRFFLGLDDCLRVTVEGVVQGHRDDADNRRWNLLVGDCSRRFWVGVNKDSLAVPPATLVDSVVRCVGVASAHFNTRSELIEPRLNVCRPEDFRVLCPGEADPFAASEVPLAAIARYPVTSHRVRTRGTVTYALPGNFLMIQQGSIGVRVGAASIDRYAPGDIVEVSGFASAATPVVGLIEAVVRRVGIVSPPEPMAIDPEKISLLNLTAAARFEVAKPGDYYGCLVTFPATVVDVHTTRAGGEVVLHTPEMGLSASADTLIFDSLRSLPTGAEVQVTGIVQPEMVASDDPTATHPAVATSRIQILLRSAADIEVVRWPSWWTPRRLAALLGVVAACAATALMWVVMLRRQVARQLGVIERKLQGEAATEERHRIAREFHDTLEQDLAGIELQLDAAADMTDDDRCRPVLHRQRALLARLRQETHDFLWDLRDPVRIDGAIVESLAAQTAYLQSGTSVPITLHANDGIGRVPADIQFHLLRIVREAIHNAVRHGDPASVVVNIGTDGTGIAVEVIDDGHGFDVTAKQGQAGHFGLRGMAERAARIGAGLAVTSTPGSGTQVRVTVPLANDGEPTSDRIRLSG